MIRVVGIWMVCGEVVVSVWIRGQTVIVHGRLLGQLGPRRRAVSSLFSGLSRFKSTRGHAGLGSFSFVHG